MRPNVPVACLLAVLVACSDSIAVQRTTSVRPGEPPFELPAHAMNVEILHDERAVRFELMEPYPARHALEEIARNLIGSGWSALSEDLWNPGIPSSNTRGWTDYIDGRTSPNVRVYQWLGYWRNARGDVVAYALHYNADDIAKGAVPDEKGTGSIKLFDRDDLRKAGVKVPGD